MGTLHQAEICGETGKFPFSAEGLRVSEAEYWETYYEMPDRVYEWNNGMLEERPVGDKETFRMHDWFYCLLREYFETCPIGEMMGMEVGFRLAIPRNASVRRPDLAVILNSNPVRMDPFDRSYGGIFDICFEFLSDSSPDMVTRDTVTKKTEYCRSGVREYFILDRKGRETAFYHLSGGAYTPIMPNPDGVIRSRVLPGFQFREEDLYTRPSWDKMAEDPVYRSFVRKAYQRERRDREKAEKQVRQERQRAETERQRAETERHRAETERQRAREERQETEKERQRAEIAEQQAREERQETEKERQRAEKLAAMLRELGIEAD
ncbi:Uma2 family endonuclease [Desulfobacterales bacterium HSG2]|nr:Uma2 family endonuclease [Desulfobacterales bacterium HSG2]